MKIAAGTRPMTSASKKIGSESTIFPETLHPTRNIRQISIIEQTRNKFDKNKTDLDPIMNTIPVIHEPIPAENSSINSDNENLQDVSIKSREIKEEFPKIIIEPMPKKHPELSINLRESPKIIKGKVKSEFAPEQGSECGSNKNSTPQHERRESNMELFKEPIRKVSKRKEIIFSTKKPEKMMSSPILKLKNYEHLNFTNSAIRDIYVPIMCEKTEKSLRHCASFDSFIKITQCNKKNTVETRKISNFLDDQAKNQIKPLENQSKIPENQIKQLEIQEKNLNIDLPKTARKDEKNQENEIKSNLQTERISLKNEENHSEIQPKSYIKYNTSQIEGNNSKTHFNISKADKSLYLTTNKKNNSKTSSIKPAPENKNEKCSLSTLKRDRRSNQRFSLIGVPRQTTIQSIMNKNSFVMQRILKAVSSMSFVRETLNIAINSEYYSRLKSREIYKQLQYNYRYENQHSFEDDILSCMDYKLGDIANPIIYWNFDYLCRDHELKHFEHPHISKCFNLMIRQLAIEFKAETQELLGKIRINEVKNGLDACFESALEFIALRTKMIEQEYEENERQKMSHDLKISWYLLNNEIHEFDYKKFENIKPASTNFTYQGKKYTYSKLIKPDKEFVLDFQYFGNNESSKSVAKKHKKKKSSSHIIKEIKSAENISNLNIPVLFETSFTEIKEYLPTKLSANNLYNMTFSLSEIVEYAKTIKDAIGDGIKNAAEEEKMLEKNQIINYPKYTEKLSTDIKKSIIFGTKEILFNIKENKLEIPSPEENIENEELTNKMRNETMRKMQTRSFTMIGDLEKSEDIYSLLGKYSKNIIPEFVLQPEDTDQNKLMHKINNEFREEFVKQMENFDDFSSSPQYNQEINDMVLHWNSLQKAVQELDTENFKTPNRSYMVDTEKIAAPFIFTGSERLKSGEGLNEGWLGHSNAKELEEIDVGTISSDSDNKYVPIKRENNILKKERKKTEAEIIKEIQDQELKKQKENEEENKKHLLQIYNNEKIDNLKDLINNVRSNYKITHPKSPGHAKSVNIELLGLQRKSLYNALNFNTPMKRDLEQAIITEESPETSQIINTERVSPTKSPFICISPPMDDEISDSDSPSYRDEGIEIKKNLLRPVAQRNESPEIQRKRDKKLQELKLELLDEVPPSPNRRISVMDQLEIEKHIEGSSTLSHKKLMKTIEFEQAKNRPLLRRLSDKALSMVKTPRPLKDPMEKVKRRNAKRKQLIKNMTGTINLQPANEEHSIAEPSASKRRPLFTQRKVEKIKLADPAHLLHNAIRRIQVYDVYFLCLFY